MGDGGCAWEVREGTDFSGRCYPDCGSVRQDPEAKPLPHPASRRSRSRSDI